MTTKIIFKKKYIYIYMPQICGVAKKLKHFKFWKNFYWKHDSNKFKLEGDLQMQWNNI